MKYFIKFKIPKIGNVKFRMLGNKYINNIWIDCVLKKNVKMYFGFIGPANDCLYNFILYCHQNNKVLLNSCIFELPQEIKIPNFRFSRVELMRYDDIDLEAIDLNPNKFIQRGNKLIKGSIYVLAW